MLNGKIKSSLTTTTLVRTTPKTLNRKKLKPQTPNSEALIHKALWPRSHYNSNPETQSPTGIVLALRRIVIIPAPAFLQRGFKAPYNYNQGPPLFA